MEPVDFSGHGLLGGTDLPVESASRLDPPLSVSKLTQAVRSQPCNFFTDSICEEYPPALLA